ncbi:MAG TPA: dihydropteroate synthase [Sphingopyxis sp.]|nr:dihydropteroate synthase [Sphingopyxis sp.]
MASPLHLSDLASAKNGACIYCRPICFVDDPRQWDDACLPLASTGLWFSSWQISLRDGGGVRNAVFPVGDWDQWIAAMPYALAGRAIAQRAAITDQRPSLDLGLDLGASARSLSLQEPQIMGIVNVTPDSFSDGGRYDSAAAAIEHGFTLMEQGAAILDVGGESTRLDAVFVGEDEEIRRVEPVIKALAGGGAIVSVDSRKAAVMEAALAAGAAMINDVSALRHDPRAMAVAAASQVPIVLMHAPSGGMNAHEAPSYTDPLLDVYDMLEQRIAACEQAGIGRDRLIVDPGIGFGKNLAENMALIHGLALFHALGCPILFAASRKRLIAALDDEAPADERLGGTLALHYYAVTQGAQMIRVHDVREHRQALRIWHGLRGVRPK